MSKLQLIKLDWIETEEPFHNMKSRDKGLDSEVLVPTEFLKCFLKDINIGVGGVVYGGFVFWEAHFTD